MILIRLLLVCFILLGCESIQESAELKLMTYNIRMNTAADGDNAWPNRSGFLSAQLLFLEPDILGVQEALPDQMADLKNVLADYKSIGVGRDGGDNGEYSGIFYNYKRVKVENENTFWLSQTPDKVSKDWDAALPRICTYGLFTEIKSKKQLWVFNTHFDHIGSEARIQSMQLILKKIAELNTASIPVVLMGDFNVEPKSTVIAEATKTMLDSRDAASIKFGAEGTFNGFRYEEAVTKRIDYILVSKSSNVAIKKYAVFSTAVDFKFPSDHFPVYIELELK
jgi:endonuclease/exonuclease/phosphatase family metal-dependent hydrolase